MLTVAPHAQRLTLTGIELAQLSYRSNAGLLPEQEQVVTKHPVKVARVAYYGRCNGLVKGILSRIPDIFLSVRSCSESKIRRYTHRVSTFTPPTVRTELVCPCDAALLPMFPDKAVSPDCPDDPGGASCSGGARCLPLSAAAPSRLSLVIVGAPNEGRASSSKSSSSEDMLVVCSFERLV